MATMTAPAAAPQIDPKLEGRYTECHTALAKAQSDLQGAENTLAAATAQFNEQCRLQAQGKKADPQTYRDSMTQIEHRIIGLKSVVAEKQGAFSAAASERAQALAEIQSHVDRERSLAVFDRFKAARAALTAAWAEVRRAQEVERRAGNDWRLESARNPSASQIIAHR
jgi:chromosome segregation ATPase